MPDNKYPVEMISGVPVMTAPAEIDVTAAEQLRAVLLEWAGHGHAMVVVDMTRTQFCVLRARRSGPGAQAGPRGRRRTAAGHPPGRHGVPDLHTDQPGLLHPPLWQPARGPPAKTRCPGSGHRVRIRLPGSAALRIGPAARIRECGPVADTRLAAASALSITGEDAHAAG